MASELNMYESQVNEYKYEIERLARELQEVKKKYFMQKKKENQGRWVKSAVSVIMESWKQPGFMHGFMLDIQIHSVGCEIAFLRILLSKCVIRMIFMDLNHATYHWIYISILWQC